MARMARSSVSVVTSSSFWTSGRTCADRQGHGGVAAPAVELAAGVERDDVPLVQRPAAGDAVDDLLVDADAGDGRERRLPLDRARDSPGTAAAAPCSRKIAATAASSSAVVTPGTAIRRTWSSACGDDPARLAHQLISRGLFSLIAERGPTLAGTEPGAADGRDVPKHLGAVVSSAYRLLTRPP